MRQFSIKLEYKNYEKLQQIKNKYKISIARTINFLIDKYLENEIDNNILFINSDPENLSKGKLKNIQITFTQKEYELLKNRKKLHLHSSLAKEAKYYIINAINDEKQLTQIELNSLALTRAEIHKIGVNINQFVRFINQNKNNIDSIPESFINNIFLLQNEIKRLKDKINILITKNNIN